MVQKKGCLISFEGLDGAGKTTQMRLLEQWLKARDISYIRTREPGGTPLGVEIRKLLFERTDIEITPLAEAFLFQADRAQHFATLVLPALEEGKLVLTDRCFDSSIAYQGVARGVGVSLVEQFSMLAVQNRVPDLTILLDLDPAKVQQRTDTTYDGSREKQSRFDAESEQFHRTLRQAFLKIAYTHPERVKMIDAAQSPEKIHEEIVTLVERIL
ncbi:MAG TPA: dTMP kinase [Ktedonobacter sp.]|nr:dTMP kinase [Ktedonobacter sp.]